MSKSGFIGLGTMGTPMASHLIRAGHALFVNTRSSGPADLVAAGAQACATAERVKPRFELMANHQVA